MKTSKNAYTYKMRLVQANVLGIVIFILLLFITSLFGFTISFNTPFFLTSMIIYFILHELLHGLGFFLGGTKLKNIVFGMAIEKGILYCQAFQEISKKNILISLQMPFMIIGVITYVIGLVLNIDFLVLLSILNLVGASMDIMMFIYISRLPKDITYSESGEPDEFVLISSKDLSKYKSMYFEITNTKKYKKSDYTFKDIKRLTISKASLIVVSILIILDLIIFIK